MVAFFTSTASPAPRVTNSAGRIVVPGAKRERTNAVKATSKTARRKDLSRKVFVMAVPICLVMELARFGLVVDDVPAHEFRLAHLDLLLAEQEEFGVVRDLPVVERRRDLVARHPRADQPRGNDDDEVSFLFSDTTGCGKAYPSTGTSPAHGICCVSATWEPCNKPAITKL